MEFGRTARAIVGALAVLAAVIIGVFQVVVVRQPVTWHFVALEVALLIMAYLLMGGRAENLRAVISEIRGAKAPPSGS